MPLKTITDIAMIIAPMTMSSIVGMIKPLTQSIGMFSP